MSDSVTKLCHQLPPEETTLTFRWTFKLSKTFFRPNLQEMSSQSTKLLPAKQKLPKFSHLDGMIFYKSQHLESRTQVALFFMHTSQRPLCRRCRRGQSMQSSLKQNRQSSRLLLCLIMSRVPRNLHLRSIALRPNSGGKWPRNRMLVRHVVVEVEADCQFSRASGIDDWKAEDLVAENIGRVWSNEGSAKCGRTFRLTTPGNGDG
jgi:hypothetical protein